MNRDDKGMLNYTAALDDQSGIPLQLCARKGEYVDIFYIFFILLKIYR